LPSGFFVIILWRRDFSPSKTLFCRNTGKHFYGMRCRCGEKDQVPAQGSFLAARRFPAGIPGVFQREATPLRGNKPSPGAGIFSRSKALSCRNTVEYFKGKQRRCGEKDQAGYMVSGADTPSTFSAFSMTIRVVSASFRRASSIFSSSPFMRQAL